ncbi:MAG: hypothetical protein K8S55_11060, partial [Phycisphaerae bacterium]|nr:hypothetical protein [Phycisphaerae bacterium]
LLLNQQEKLRRAIPPPNIRFRRHHKPPPLSSGSTGSYARISLLSSRKGGGFSNDPGGEEIVQMPSRGDLGRPPHNLYAVHPPGGHPTSRDDWVPWREAKRQPRCLWREVKNIYKLHWIFGN